MITLGEKRNVFLVVNTFSLFNPRQFVFIRVRWPRCTDLGSIRITILQHVVSFSLIYAVVNDGRTGFLSGTIWTTILISFSVSSVFYSFFSTGTVSRVPDQNGVSQA